MSNQSAVLEQKPEAAPMPAGDSWPDFRAARDAELPAWFRDQQRAAWAQFAALADADAQRSGMAFFKCQRARSFALLSPRHCCPRPTAARFSNALPASRKSPAGLIFADDQLLASAIRFPKKLRKAGVILKPLERAMIEHEDLFRRISWPSRPRSGRRSLPHCTRRSSDRGLSFTCRAAWRSSCRLEIFHWLHAENAAIFPHTLVVAEELSKVTVVEHFRSTDRRARRLRLRCKRLDRGEPGRKVTYVCAQRLERQSVSRIQINATTVARDATALNLHLASRRRNIRVSKV